ncbi:MAG: molybdenum ABC transporter ATP-binding protein [Betaproteobacteria bacterium]
MMIDVDVEQQLGTFHLNVMLVAQAPVLGLFGRSGAGKSSLINAIAGVTTPTRGHIRINDVTLFDSTQRINVPTAKRRLGYVFQDALLFPHLSVETNLLYGLRLRSNADQFIQPSRVIEVLGLGPLLHRRPGALSGGEKQRVAIGRALLAQPMLLLLDEPLASLDVPRRTEILDYIERLRDEFRIPIIYVSHSVAEITRLADAVAILSEGKCVAVGDVDDVMNRMELKPITGRYEAGSIIDTTVTGHDNEFQLTTLQFSGGELIIPGLATRIGERVRTRIRARDVSLATTRPDGISILNVLRGRVIAIRDESGPLVDIQLAVGDATLMARITQRSRAQLGITEQQEVFAMVKAVSFDHRSIGYA